MANRTFMATEKDTLFDIINKTGSTIEYEFKDLKLAPYYTTKGNCEVQLQIESGFSNLPKGRITKVNTKILRYYDPAVSASPEFILDALQRFGGTSVIRVDIYEKGIFSGQPKHSLHLYNGMGSPFPFGPACSLTKPKDINQEESSKLEEFLKIFGVSYNKTNDNIKPNYCQWKTDLTIENQVKAYRWIQNNGFEPWIYSKGKGTLVTLGEGLNHFRTRDEKRIVLEIERNRSGILGGLKREEINEIQRFVESNFDILFNERVWETSSQSQTRINA